MATAILAVCVVSGCLLARPVIAAKRKLVG